MTPLQDYLIEIWYEPKINKKKYNLKDINMYIVLVQFVLILHRCQTYKKF